jgi:hypothetical protein
MMSSVSRPGLSHVVQTSQWANWAQAQRKMEAPTAAASASEPAPAPPPLPELPAALAAAPEGSQQLVAASAAAVPKDEMPDPWAGAIPNQPFTAGMTVHSDDTWDHWRQGEASSAMCEAGKGGGKFSREDRRSAEADVLGRQSCNFMRFGAQRPPPPPPGFPIFAPQLPAELSTVAAGTTAAGTVSAAICCHTAFASCRGLQMPLPEQWFCQLGRNDGRSNQELSVVGIYD